MRIVVGYGIFSLAVWSFAADSNPFDDIMAWMIVSLLKLSTVITQLGLFAVGSILWIGSHRRRLAASIIVAAFWFACWSLSLYWGGRGSNFSLVQYPIQMALFMPAIALTIQTPLWLARNWLNLKIVSGPIKDNKSSMSVRDLLVATGAAAFAFSCVRLAYHLNANGQRGFFSDLLNGGDVSQIAMFGLVLFTASVMTTFPVMIATLRKNALALRLICLTTYVILWWPSLNLIFNDSQEAKFWGEWLRIIFLGTFGFTLTLLYLRSQGFRLLWRNEKYDDALQCR